MARNTVVLALCLTLGAPGALVSQVQAPEDAPLRRYLSGPRFGLTTFTGDVATLRHRAGLQPMMTQLGYQIETQILSGFGGSQALLEVVALVGGIGQGEINVTYAFLAGYRLANGLELGAGPSWGFNRDSADTSTAMVVAAGATLPLGGGYLPLNLALSMAEGGPRITTLVGWIVE